MITYQHKISIFNPNPNPNPKFIHQITSNIKNNTDFVKKGYLFLYTRIQSYFQLNNCKYLAGIVPHIVVLKTTCTL
jgi:hypothetical protein